VHYLLVLCFAINPSRLSLGLPFRSNTNDAVNIKGFTPAIAPMLPAITRLVQIIANSITPQMDANLTRSPKMKATDARISRRVKKYVKGTAMLDPNRFRTSGCGCPDANIAGPNFPIAEFIQVTATISLSATKPYPPRGIDSAKRNERSLEVKS
jgi:hypothetical protein